MTQHSVHLSGVVLALWLAFATSHALGDTAQYSYDSLGRLTSVTYSDGSVVRYTYDSAGNRTQHIVTTSVGNQAPVAINDNVDVAVGVPLTFDPRVNDSDPNSDPITLSATSLPTKGTASIGGNGTSMTYTPHPGQSGADSFVYTISDPSGATATATVLVLIGQ